MRPHYETEKDRANETKVANWYAALQGRTLIETGDKLRRLSR